MQRKSDVLVSYPQVFNAAGDLYMDIQFSKRVDQGQGLLHTLK